MARFIYPRILLLVLVLAASTVYVNAEVPLKINYQGRLTDSNGDPVADDTYNITFSIHTAFEDGNQVWTSGQRPVQVTNGLFNYVLGSNVTLHTYYFPTTGSRYLGIKVGDDDEIVPRTEFISVPYSYRTGSISGATGGYILGSISLTEHLASDAPEFRIYFPGNIVFDGSCDDGTDFIIGASFRFNMEQGGRLRLGTETEGYNLPASDGSAGQVLSTDGSGDVSWGNAIPTGVIVMWSGAIAGIPAGWALCDGTDGTPDLRDRFILGAGNSYSVGDAGGTATHTLTADEMPSHDHGGSISGTTSYNGNHVHGFYGTPVLNPGGNTPLFVQSNEQYLDYTQYGGNHSHPFSANVNSEGGGQPHENRPPYYALAYIIKQ